MAKNAYIGGYGGIANNLFVNADFSNGTTSWQVNTFGSSSISNKIIKLQMQSTQSSSKWIFGAGTGNTSIVSGHVFYIALKIRKTTGTASSVQFTFGYDTKTISTDWVKISGRISKSANSSDMLLYSTFNSGDVFEITEPEKYDLTAIFGAGNEPTKEWCDENIIPAAPNKALKIKDCYIGVNGIAKRIVKGYIGINNIAKCFFSKYNDVNFSTCPFPTTWSSGYYYSSMYKANEWGTWTTECNDLYSNNSSNGVSNAFDNSTSTYYRTDDTGAEQWIEIRCPDGVTIKPNQFELNYQYCGSNSKLQGLTVDDTWVDLAILKNSTSIVDETIIVNPSQFFKGFRIYIYEYSSTYDSAYIYTFKNTVGTIRQEIAE